jgi:hypothetical protein
MKDIEQQMREELQSLLEENPNLDPVPLLDHGQIVTLTILDGIPAITLVDAPSSYTYDLRDVSDLRGTSLYRIYQLLKSLKLLELESQAERSGLTQSQIEIVPDNNIRIEPPTAPDPIEIVSSAASGNMDIRTREDRHGMYRNLENMQAKLREITAQNPELEPLVIRTATSNLTVSVVGGKLTIETSPTKGKSYAQVSNTLHAQLLRLSRTIEGLEKKLYGSSTEIKVAKTPVKISAADNLTRILTELECGNLAIFIRSRKQTLYISGTNKTIHYRGIKTTLEDDTLVDKEFTKEPSGYTKVEYGALPKEVITLLQAYWAYISPKSSKQEN